MPPATWCRCWPSGAWCCRRAGVPAGDPDPGTAVAAHADGAVRHLGLHPQRPDRAGRRPAGEEGVSGRGGPGPGTEGAPAPAGGDHRPVNETGGEQCARCGRAAAVLPGRVAGGRVCGNCLQILASEPCAGCGGRRPVAGRGSDGRPWCTRCRNRARAAATDNQRRRLIIEAVTAADPAVTAEAVGAALAAAGSRRSLRLLAGHLAAHPDAFTAGPTSTLAVLERFVTALAEAGARVTVIHPVCEWCGRQRRWHARTAGGGQCTTCSARTHRAACSACGKPRHADRCDAEGRPVCFSCAGQAHQARRLGTLAAEIAAAVIAAHPAARPDAVAAALDHVAPGVPGRAGLAALVRNGPALAQPARRQVRVACLLAELRREGIGVPAALCEDCGGPAEPLVIDGPIARCEACRSEEHTSELQSRPHLV